MEAELQIRELKEAMKTTESSRLNERYQAVKLVLEGRTRKEAVHIIGRDKHNVSRYVKNYSKISFKAWKPKSRTDVLFC